MSSKVVSNKCHDKISEFIVEIQYLETVEKECDRQAAQAAVELESVQRKDAEVDNELQELDIVSWADKLEIEKQNQKTLQVSLCQFVILVSLDCNSV